MKTLRQLYSRFDFLRREGASWLEKLAVRGRVLCDVCLRRRRSAPPLPLPRRRPWKRKGGWNRRRAVICVTIYFFFLAEEKEGGGKGEKEGGRKEEKEREKEERGCFRTSKLRPPRPPLHSPLPAGTPSFLWI